MRKFELELDELHEYDSGYALTFSAVGDGELEDENYIHINPGFAIDSIDGEGPVFNERFVYLLQQFTGGYQLGVSITEDLDDDKDEPHVEEVSLLIPNATDKVLWTLGVADEDPFAVYGFKQPQVAA